MLAFFRTSEILKSTPRKGWLIRGIQNGESVAEHMYQMGLICLAYPWQSEAERALSLEMAIAHDAPEAIAGDIVPSDNIDRESKHVRESLGLDFLCCIARQGGNADLANRMKALWDEYEEGSSIVSKVVHQIDKLEALQQAYIYTVRYPEHDLTDFKRHREYITDPWLSQQADEILRQWDGIDTRTNSNLTVIFVVGGPGVGKGTQCALVADQFNFEHISVGDLLRIEEKNSQSFFSGFIRDSFLQSVVVPAALTMQLLEKRVRRAQEQGKVGVLIDGFPRSLEQLQAFQQQIAKTYATIVMDCPDEILYERLSNRAVSSGRDDDESALISRRVQSYQASQEKVIEHLSKDWLTRIECAGSVETTRVAFQQALQNIIDSHPSTANGEA